MPAKTCKVTDLQFAFSCIRHSNNGTASTYSPQFSNFIMLMRMQVDFQQVADECGMTKGAAGVKFGRMKKTYAICSEDDKGGPLSLVSDEAAGSKSEKRKAVTAKKRKLDGDDEGETEQQRAKVKQEVQDDVFE